MLSSPTFLHEDASFARRINTREMFSLSPENSPTSTSLRPFFSSSFLSLCPSEFPEFDAETRFLRFRDAFLSRPVYCRQRRPSPQLLFHCSGEPSSPRCCCGTAQPIMRTRGSRLNGHGSSIRESYRFVDTASVIPRLNSSRNPLAWTIAGWVCNFQATREITKTSAVSFPGWPSRICRYLSHARARAH